MPGTTQGERLFTTSGPQNSAVLMDIISKLKKDLHQSRTENAKLVDQLNCLITLVKRAWAGDQGATTHLANIVGVSPPEDSTMGMTRNTPEHKSIAVKNWERLAIRLLDREYAAVQRQIREQQALYLYNRHRYMDEVLNNHHDQMTKFAAQRQQSAKSVEDVDKKFVRCYSAGKVRRPVSGKKSLYRPRSAYNPAPRTASEMAAETDITFSELLSSGPAPTREPSQSGITPDKNATFTGLYRLNHDEQERQYEDRLDYDDSRRYKKSFLHRKGWWPVKSNLFDPDVIFGPDIMPSEGKTRPLSASNFNSREGVSLQRPKSASVFITQTHERPLKYETTRPVKMKPKSASKRAKSANLNLRRTKPPQEEERERLVSFKDAQDENQFGDIEGPEENGLEKTDRSEQPVSETTDKPPIAVKVQRNDPIDKFVADLKRMNEMEEQFKKTAIGLQKKIGITDDGIVF